MRFLAALVVSLGLTAAATGAASANEFTRVHRDRIEVVHDRGVLRYDLRHGYYGAARVERRVLRVDDRAYRHDAWRLWHARRWW